MSKVLYSKNGKDWTAANDTPFVTGNGKGVAYSPVQDLWVAVGEGGTKHIYYSKNGKDWTAANGTPFGTGNGYDVAYSPVQDLWVAVGE